MLKASIQLRQYCRSYWGPLAGIITGLFFIGLQLSSPHVGDSCSRLGEVAQEWRIGLPTRGLMCIATIDGQLVYDRPIMPPPPRTKVAALNQF